MRNKCGETMKIAEVDKETKQVIETETTIANELCKYYEIACQRLK